MPDEPDDEEPELEEPDDEAEEPDEVEEPALAAAGEELVEPLSPEPDEPLTLEEEPERLSVR